MSHDTICSGSKIIAVADAIRAKAGSSAPMTLDEMAETVRTLQTGGGDDGTLRSVLDRSVTELVDDTIEELEAYSLYGCSRLKRVILPNLRTVRGNVFSECSSVAEWYFPNVDRWDSAIPPSNAISAFRLPRCTIFNGRGTRYLERLSLPAITKIGGSSISTFSSYYYSALRDIDLPELLNFESTGSSSSYVFDECPALESLNAPKLKSMGRNAFRNCQSLESLYLPSLTTIRYQTCFYGCTSLVAIVLAADTMCSLGSSATTTFYGTTNFRNGGTGYVYVPAALLESYKTDSNWMAIGDQIRTIEDYPDVVAQARAKAESAAQGWD